MNYPVPIVYILFNRLDCVEQSFPIICSIRPKQLFLIADGPRKNNQIDVEKVQACRNFIENQIDFDCQISRFYRSSNLGCSKSISEGLNSVFSMVDHAIILEDDCVPDLSFFQFCEELLELYKDDDRIGMISGNNFGFDLYENSLSYSFSKHGKISGWATWKRCWQKFDLSLSFLNEKTIDLVRSNISSNAHFVEKWWEGVEAVLKGRSDSWAYPWAVTRYANNWLTIRPNVNLVGHIGFGEEATHTKGKGKDIYRQTSPMSFPLRHPDLILSDSVADKQLEVFTFPLKVKRNIFQKARIKISKVLQSLRA